MCIPCVATGDIGPRGETGARGPEGVSGPTGDRGPTGESCQENECLIDNGGCQHRCVDTFDSYYCACDPGYEVVNNVFSCPGQSVNRTRLYLH